MLMSCLKKMRVFMYPNKSKSRTHYKACLLICAVKQGAYSLGRQAMMRCCNGHGKLTLQKHSAHG